MTEIKMLSELEQSFITLVSQHHAINGSIMSVDVAEEEYLFTPQEFRKLIKSKAVQMALKERGIEAEHYVVPIDADVPAKWRHKSLTPTQLVVANTMLDLIDTRSQKKKLQDLQVSTARYNTWLKDPVFAQYLQDRAESMLGENQHEAHLALLDKVRQGDVRAIMYYNEMTGRFVKESDKGGNTAQIDVRNLIVSIIEIINDEVQDRDTAIRISERFRSMISARTIAGALVGDEEPITVPTIIENRELSPRLKELMKGEVEG